MMPKYQAIPRAVGFVSDDHFSAAFPAADQVIEADHSPVKIYRMPQNIPGSTCG